MYVISKSTLKKYLILTIVTSLIISALLGIITLLSGEVVSWEVITTTIVVGLFSIFSLGSLRGFESTDLFEKLISQVGVVTSLLATGLLLFLIWFSPDFWDGETYYRITAIASVLAVALSHISLILPFAKQSMLTAALVSATSGVVAIVAAIIVSLIVFEANDYEGIYRVLGVFAILDVLGTILVPISSKFVPPSKK